MDDSDSQQIAGLKSVIEHLLASQMVLSVRLDALRKMATDALEQQGFEIPNHPNLLSALRAMEREGCHNLLAGVSDNDPNLATTLKRVIDQALHD